MLTAVPVLSFSTAVPATMRWYKRYRSRLLAVAPVIAVEVTVDLVE